MGVHCPNKRGTLLMGDPFNERQSLEHRDEGHQEEPEDKTCLGYGTLSYLAYMGEVDGHHSDVSLWVARCALATPKPEDDWHRTNIFYTDAKSGDKIYKLIVDNSSCTNVVSTSTSKSKV